MISPLSSNGKKSKPIKPQCFICSGFGYIAIECENNKKKVIRAFNHSVTQKSD